MTNRSFKIWNIETGTLINYQGGFSQSILTSLCLDYKHQYLFVGDHLG